MHSNRSDGYDAPSQVVKNAKAESIGLMALTDHDCTEGVLEAVQEGKVCGVVVLPAVEMDTEWPVELHILGLDIDINHPRLVVALDIARQRRTERNTVIFEKLLKVGCDVRPYLANSTGSITRMHIAMALVNGGFATDVRDAFARYLRRGCPGFYAVRRFTPEEVIDTLTAAGGVPVWAHPFHCGESIHKLSDQLVSDGIMGIEAYHSSSTEGQSEILLSIAKQRGLLVTCGSDSHGKNRPGVTIGCTWRDTPELNETYMLFMGRRQSRLDTDSM